MAQLQLSVVSKGSSKEKYHLVIYVGPPGDAPQYCLVLIVGFAAGSIQIQDLKQASPDDVKSYLLDIFKRDTTTTTLSCPLEPAQLTKETLVRILAAVAMQTLGAPKGTPVAGSEKLERYVAGGQMAAAAPSKAPPAPPKPAAAAPPPPKPAAPSPPRPAAPKAPPPGMEDEDSFDSILGGSDAPPLAPAIQEVAAKLPKVQGVKGAEGKLAIFTTEYAKVLAQFAHDIKAAGQDAGAIKTAAAHGAKEVKRILKEITLIAPEFVETAAWGKVTKDLNAIYIRKLHINLPEFKEKSRSEIIRLLSKDLTGSSKLETESISVQFLYKNRFDLDAELSDPLRDLLRFSFNKPLVLEENFPFVTKRVDLTKLYYRFAPSEGAQRLLTDIFCFREIDGRAGLVYVPYEYLGTGAFNQLLMDFFATPWNSS